MARITTRDQFKCYVLKKVGEPLLDLVLEKDLIDECSTTGTTATTGTSATDTTTTATTATTAAAQCATFASSVCTQLDLAIDDALDYFHHQASELANVKAMLRITLVDQQHFYEIPDCILSVEQDLRKGTSFRFDAEEGAEAVGLFSLQSQFGPRGVFSYMGAGGHDALLTYDIAQQYNNLVDLRYTQKFNTEFNLLQHQLFITPTPSSKDDGHSLMYLCNVKVPDEHLFEHLWVQRYATALTMEQIGRNLSMYTGIQLPGGGDFNSSFYWDMGREDKKELEEELASGKWGNPPASSFFTG